MLTKLLKVEDKLLWIYDNKIRNPKIKNMKDLFLCSTHLHFLCVLFSFHLDHEFSTFYDFYSYETKDCYSTTFDDTGREHSFSLFVH